MTRLPEREWLKLADATPRFVALEYDGANARDALCILIADRKIKCRVTIAAADLFFPGKVLSGGHVEPPERLSPSDLDWELSRPLAPWVTRTDRDDSPFWSHRVRAVARPIHLLELARRDVESAIAKLTADYEAVNLAGAGDRTASRGRRAIPNKPGAGGRKMADATKAMVAAVREGRITLDALGSMKQKELVCLYSKAGRTTLVQAREAALGELERGCVPEKAPAQSRQSSGINPTNDK